MLHDALHAQRRRKLQEPERTLATQRDPHAAQSRQLAADLALDRSNLRRQILRPHLRERRRHDGGRERIAGECAARQHAPLNRIPALHDDASDGKSIAHRLPDENDVRREPERMMQKRRAGSVEPREDLVGDQQRSAVGTDLCQLTGKLRGRDVTALRAQQPLEEHGRDALRRNDVPHIGQDLVFGELGQILQAVKIRQRHELVRPAQARGRHRFAVHGPVESHDLAAARGLSCDADRELDGLHPRRIQNRQLVRIREKAFDGGPCLVSCAGA